MTATLPAPMEPHDEGSERFSHPPELTPEQRGVLEHVFDSEIVVSDLALQGLRALAPDPLAPTEDHKRWVNDTAKLAGRVEALRHMRARILGEETPEGTE